MEAAIQSGNHTTLTTSVYIYDPAVLEISSYIAIYICFSSHTQSVDDSSSVLDSLFVCVCVRVEKALENRCGQGEITTGRRNEKKRREETGLMLEIGGCCERDMKVPGSQPTHTHNKTQQRERERESMPWQLAIDGRACICVVTLFTALAAEFRHCLVNLLVRIPLLLLLLALLDSPW